MTTTKSRLTAAQASLGFTGQGPSCLKLRRQALLLALLGFKAQYGLNQPHGFRGFRWASYCWSNNYGRAYQPCLKG